MKVLIHGIKLNPYTSKMHLYYFVKTRNVYGCLKAMKKSNKILTDHIDKVDKRIMSFIKDVCLRLNATSNIIIYDKMFENFILIQYQGSNKKIHVTLFSKDKMREYINMQKNVTDGIDIKTYLSEYKQLSTFITDKEMDLDLAILEYLFYKNNIFVPTILFGNKDRIGFANVKGFKEVKAITKETNLELIQITDSAVA